MSFLDFNVRIWLESRIGNPLFYYNTYVYFYVYNNSRIGIQTEHKDIEIHIKYRNKKWVTTSKGAPGIYGRYLPFWTRMLNKWFLMTEYKSEVTSQKYLITV